jgi:hypothetical protein
MLSRPFAAGQRLKARYGGPRLGQDVFLSTCCADLAAAEGAGGGVVIQARRSGNHLGEEIYLASCNEQLTAGNRIGARYLGPRLGEEVYAGGPCGGGPSGYYYYSNGSYVFVPYSTLSSYSSYSSPGCICIQGCCANPLPCTLNGLFQCTGSDVNCFASVPVVLTTSKLNCTGGGNATWTGTSTYPCAAFSTTITVTVSLTCAGGVWGGTLEFLSSPATGCSGEAFLVQTSASCEPLDLVFAVSETAPEFAQPRVGASLTTCCGSTLTHAVTLTLTVTE